eukprot:5327541-Amphidinium_carterae.1
MGDRSLNGCYLPNRAALLRARCEVPEARTTNKTYEACENIATTTTTRMMRMMMMRMMRMMMMMMISCRHAPNPEL